MQLSLDFEAAPKRKQPILGLPEFNRYLYSEKLTKTGRKTGVLYWEEHRRIAALKGASYLGRYIHPDLAEDIGVEIMLECVEKLREHLRRNTFLKSGYNFFGILNSSIIRAIIDRQRQYQRRAKSALHTGGGQWAGVGHAQDEDLPDEFTPAVEHADSHHNQEATDDVVILDDDDSLNPSGFTSEAVRQFMAETYTPVEAKVILAYMVEDKPAIPGLIADARLTTAKAKALHLRALAECRQWFLPEPITIDNHDGSCYIITPTWKDNRRYCAVQYLHAPNVSAVHLGKGGNPVGYKHGFQDEQQARWAIAIHSDPDATDAPTPIVTPKAKIKSK
jgi:hypothetical protein